MMFKKEKEVIGDMIEHINAVEACAKTALRAIEIYIEGDTTEWLILFAMGSGINSIPEHTCPRSERVSIRW
jgi:hypothetical protein